MQKTIPSDQVKRIHCELASRDLWHYCKIKAPDFYNDNAPYLQEICDAIQEFENDDMELLIVNMPPRHGKSRTAVNAVQWLLGKNPRYKIMTCSYNEKLSRKFSKQTRNAIQEQSRTGKIAFTDVFQNVKIKYGSASVDLWALDGNDEENYLATSPGSTTTGIGCFPQGTLIATPNGYKDIQSIALEDIPQVLTLCHENGIIEACKVTASRRIMSNELIKITTNTGRIIISTSDHRYYANEHGYVEGRCLQKGNSIKTLQRNMQAMRETEGKRRNRAVQGLLQKKPVGVKNKFCLQSLWERISAICLRINENAKKWHGNKILFKKLFVKVERQSAKDKKVFNVRNFSAIPHKQKILLDRVQGKSKITKKTACKSDMPNMRERFRSKKPQDTILQSRLCEQIPFKSNDRQRKFTLQNWRELYQRISRYAKAYFGKRQLCLHELRDSRNILFNKKVCQSIKSSYSPFRRKPAKQQNAELDYSLHTLPYFTTQNETITSIEIWEEEIPVYDITVEKNHNFFANGILVHNCDFALIDDIVKNAYEAFNESILEGHFEWFTDTLYSRLEGKRKLLLFMTRWATKDLAGRLIELYTDQGRKFKVITKKACDDGVMLNDSILNYEQYLLLADTIGEDIVDANYNNAPVDLKGKLYGEFITYTDPPQFSQIQSMCDPADEGSDYLCNIIYGIVHGSDKAYILDVYYTKDNLDKTEKEIPKRLKAYDVNFMIIENNFGGNAFKKIIQNELIKIGGDSVRIMTFTQTLNKVARILSNSTNVQRQIYMPEGWKKLFPQFYKDVTDYQKEGKNKHDDGPDTLTMIVERVKRASGKQLPL